MPIISSQTILLWSLSPNAFPRASAAKKDIINNVSYKTILMSTSLGQNHAIGSAGNVPQVPGIKGANPKPNPRP
ncbi:MAG: hypothetical protein VXW87_01310 [Pseudomonadota bacterium]|nr:hypothetical protein [Pseudomonadota bacterium]